MSGPKRQGKCGPIRRPAALFGLVLSLFLAVSSILPMSAVAQTVMPRDKIEGLLKVQYGETPVARGLMHSGWLVEVFASPGGVTWTMVFTTPGGLSRVGSTGVAWSSVDSKPGRR